jgi:peptide/nickel transport system permease protein
MLRYLGGRLLEMVPVVILMSVAAFLVIHLVPGDPVRLNLGFRADPAEVAQKRAELGLDRSLPTQYADFVGGAVRLDFGDSIDSGEKVSSILSRRVGPSALLIAYALTITLLVAVPLAMLAAVRRRSWVDQGVRLLSTITFVMPSFWLALLLVWVVGVQMGLLPTSGYGETATEHLQSLTLPAITIALALAPVAMRLLRSNLIETLQSEYIEAAQARGLTGRRVLFKHALRPSGGSTVTVLGYLFAVLLSSTVVVETIFAIPGLGSLLVESVSARDFPVVSALTLLFGVAVLAVSLLTDVIYATLDPRVRL